MNQMYTPAPLDTRDIELPKELDELIEEMARNVHDVWAQGRIAEGWTYGKQRDDKRKTHPCLVSYEELPDAEREMVGRPLRHPAAEEGPHIRQEFPVGVGVPGRRNRAGDRFAFGDDELEFPVRLSAFFQNFLSAFHHKQQNYTEVQ